ncbi:MULTISPECIES: hypothetical protein [Emticicia]|uniref:hypothetical protein n=1 Tax=Emticicia TaxID=312278 RepID=UPI00209E6133|nr:MULTISPECIES: hypothetical protein [Emticicia]UTA66610.1 hypothetical protein MB380_13470 [Emticicia sp. 21SJ11W-3]
MRRSLFLFLLLGPPVLGGYLMGFLNIGFSKPVILGFLIYITVVILLRILYKKSSYVQKLFMSKEKLERLKAGIDDQYYDYR